MLKKAVSQEERDRIAKFIIRIGKKCKQTRNSTPNPARYPIISTLGDATFAEFIKAYDSSSDENVVIDKEPWEDYYTSKNDK